MPMPRFKIFNSGKIRLVVAGLVIIFVTIFLALNLFLKSIYVPPILMYHSIDYYYKENKLCVSPESFARQVEFLHKNRYNVVTLEKMVSYIKNKEKIPPKTLAITFDDGWYNNYKYAYPVLKKYNIPATIFIIIKQIGKSGWLGWEEIKEMSDSGIVTIGSHGKFHSWLPNVGAMQLKTELWGSKKILEKNIGKSVELFCYPLGAFDDRTKSAVQEAGYIGAVGTNPGKHRRADDIYALKRIRISRTSDNLFVFWLETSGYYTWFKERGDY